MPSPSSKCVFLAAESALFREISVNHTTFSSVEQFAAMLCTCCCERCYSNFRAHRFGSCYYCFWHTISHFSYAMLQPAQVRQHAARRAWTARNDLTSVLQMFVFASWPRDVLLVFQVLIMAVHRPLCLAAIGLSRLKRSLSFTTPLPSHFMHHVLPILFPLRS